VLRNKAGWHLAVCVVKEAFHSRIVILHLSSFGRKKTRLLGVRGVTAAKTGCVNKVT